MQPNELARAELYVVILLLLGGHLGDAAAQSWEDDESEASGCLSDKLSCDTSQQQTRCECHPSCVYFGSCCSNASFAADGGRVARPLPRQTYQCGLERYGGKPIYVVSKCPPNGGGGGGVPRPLVDLCDQPVQEKNYYDTRFWPVSSSARQLVYRSAYCALCHGEALKNVSRWTAILRCPNGTATTNGTQVLSRCELQFRPPDTDSALPRCWKSFVDECRSDPTNASSAADPSGGTEAPAAASGTDAAKACYDEPQAVVWRDEIPFRNLYCAQCSGIRPLELSCSEVRSDKVRPKPPVDLSIRLLLNPGGPSPGDGRCSAAAEARQGGCGSYEFYDYSLCQCQPLCPPSSLQLTDGSCQEVVSLAALPPPTATNRFSAPTSIASAATTRRLIAVGDCAWTSYQNATAVLDGNGDAALSGVIRYSSVDEEDGAERDEVIYVVSPGASRPSGPVPATEAVLCARCRWFTLPPDSTVGNLTGGVLWLQMGRWFRRPIIRASKAATIVCLDPDEVAAFERVLTIGEGAGRGGCGQALDAVGVILMAASIVCLAVHAVAFFFISALRNVPGKVVFSQVIALLLSYALFLSRVAAAENASACYAVSVAVHYFLLAYFVWTLALAVEIHGAVQLLKKVYSDSRQFIAYSLVGWISPLAVVAAALLVDRYGSERFRPGYGGEQCWMTNSHGYRIFFSGPMCALVLADVVLYSAIVVRIFILSRNTVHVRNAQHEKAALSAKLLFALGVLWLFAVVGTASGNTVVICLFSNVLNTSQGVVIFAIFFCSNKRVLETLRCDVLDRLRSSLIRGPSSLASSLIAAASGNSSSGVANGSMELRPVDFAQPGREAPSGGCTARP